MNTKHEWEEKFKAEFHNGPYAQYETDDGEKLMRWIGEALQKAREEGRADWLRSEIEKLEKQFKEVSNIEVLPEDGFNEALTSIITRHKEELLELEKGV